MTEATNAAKPHVLAALRKANAVIGIGDVHGWPRPQGYNDALAMLNAAREAGRVVPELPGPAAKPEGVAKWIDATVAVRQHEAVRRDVVDELVLNWEREAAAAGLAAAGDINSRLATAFNSLVAELDDIADAPRTLTGREDDAEVQAHTSALRTATDLTAALVHRAQIADAVGESEDVGADIVWLVLDPHADATRDQVQDALAKYKGRFPEGLAEWDELRPLGLRLAQLGEVGARRQRHANLVYEIGMRTPEMGMRDYSYGEIESGGFASRNAALIQGETDAMFARESSIAV